MTLKLQKRLREQSRSRRRKKIIRRIAFFFIFLIVSLGAGGWFLFSDRFRVRDVQISEVKQADAAMLRSTVENWLSGSDYYVVPRNVLWAFSAHKLEQYITASFPTIKSVNIARNFPHTLQLHIQEYDAWGVLCHGESETCFWIDRDGTAFESAPEFSGLIVPKIHDNRPQDYQLGKQYLSDNLMNLIAYFNERAVSDNYLQSLQFIIDEKDETLRVRTRLGWDILLLESNDPEKSYKNLRVALDGEIKDRVAQLEYIDLRFGNRLFYKFRE